MEQKINLAGTFLEIARTPRKKRDTFMIFCLECSKHTEHTCKDKGLDEIYTCEKCGSMRSYRVR